MDDIRRTHDDMRKEVMRKVKFGQTLCINENNYGDKPLRVRVVAFYENYVLCHNGHGYETCYRYHELWERLHHRQNNIKIPKYIKGWRVDERRT